MINTFYYLVPRDYNKSENLILKNLNMEISGGKMTALVGHSGAGKSSILNLIPRFYDVKNGEILIDKKNVKNVDLWKKLKELIKSKQIEWYWIKGHSNDPMNDLADKLAKEATPI